MMKEQKWYTSPGRLAVFIIFCLMAFNVIVPLIWMVSSSLKTNVEFYASPWSVPAKLMWENYVEAFKFGVGKYFLNSVLVTSVTIVLTVIIGAMASYILSRFQFRGKELVLYLFLGGLTISPEVNLVSLYKLMQSLHLYNSLVGLILLYVSFKIPFTVILIRSYMLTLPKEVEEAAYIDGCTAWGVFWKIALPVCRPILASAALLAGMDAWNEYMFAAVFIESNSLKTIPVGLVGLQDTLSTNYPVLIAGLTISASVMIILFLIFQRQFIRGLSQGSVKG